MMPPSKYLAPEGANGGFAAVFVPSNDKRKRKINMSEPRVLLKNMHAIGRENFSAHGSLFALCNAV
jgi:hypothetical protein